MGLDGEAFVKQFLEAWNAHDVDGVMALMTGDCVFEASFGVDAWGTRYTGAAEVRAGVEELFRSIPDIRWDGIRHFVCEDHAVVEWTTTGTRPGGVRFEVQGCDILTLREGKIAAKRAYRKSAL
ncbi:MAG: nuclear transport factor 2 family protein [Candidatus Methylomirabilia bacterium]